MRGLLLRQSRAVVGDGQRRASIVVAELDRNRRARRRVRTRVRKEVVEHLAQPVLVAGERRRLDRELDRTAGLDYPRRVDGFTGDGGEIDRLPFERPALVETREQEEVVDEQ